MADETVFTDKELFSDKEVERVDEFDNPDTLGEISDGILEDSGDEKCPREEETVPTTDHSLTRRINPKKQTPPTKKNIQVQICTPLNSNLSGTSQLNKFFTIPFWDPDDFKKPYFRI